MKAVVDASALLATAEPGREDFAEAGELLATAADVWAPALLAWEVANVVHRKRPAAFGPDAKARAALTAALLDGVDLVAPDDDHLREVARLVHEHGVSAYDAAYLALAVVEDALLVTEDARLHAAAKREIGAQRAWRLLDALRLRPEEDA